MSADNDTGEEMQSELDLAHAAMEQLVLNGPEEAADTARLKFYECFADTELLVLLSEEHQGGETLKPQLFELEDGPFLLCFDSEERLASFAELAVPYAALPGRVIAQMLEAEGVGIGLNLGVAPSSFLMPAEAVDWLVSLLQSEPEGAEAVPVQFLEPGKLPEVLMLGLADRLVRLAGFAQEALLAGVRYDDGHIGHLLAFIDPVPGGESALAKAVSEALTFSGIDAGEIDVTFLTANMPATGEMRRLGRLFRIPEPTQPEADERPAPKAPGSDPDKPPILR